MKIFRNLTASVLAITAVAMFASYMIGIVISLPTNINANKYIEISIMSGFSKVEWGENTVTTHGLEVVWMSKLAEEIESMNQLGIPARMPNEADWISFGKESIYIPNTAKHWVYSEFRIHMAIIIGILILVIILAHYFRNKPVAGTRSAQPSGESP